MEFIKQRHRKKRPPMKIVNSSSSSSSPQQQQIVTLTLPDDCWESIFKFIINDNKDCNISRYLNPLSLVSKEFLNVTNRLQSSLTIRYKLSDFPSLFKRFTNLNSLKLGYRIDSNYVLSKISDFPLKITSLNLCGQRTIPAIGLRTFSQKITTLTSLTCYNVESLSSSDLLLIAECFPLLEELDLSEPENYTSYTDGFEALSLALCKLRKINITEFPINDQSLFHLFNNCKLLQDVIMSRCYQITNAGIASALRERPSLTGLLLDDLNISDELLYSIAREHLPLRKLHLRFCYDYSYNGIFCLLSKCQRIQYLDLQDNDFLNDQHVVELSSFLGDLVSINLSNCYKLTKSALFALTRNSPSLCEIKMERIGSGVRGDSNSLEEFGVYPKLKSLYLGYNSWLTDESIIIFASMFPNLQLLDLNNCRCISEGICQVLRRCCKIRKLNLVNCSKVKLIGVNFVVPKLEVLDLSKTNLDDETLYVISKSCCGLLELSLKSTNGVTEKGLKHMVKNCTKLGSIMVRGIHISDKNKELFRRHGCNSEWIPKI